MLEGGADIRSIQQLLGHEKLDTTATATATEVSIRQFQEVHARCHPSSRPLWRAIASGEGGTFETALGGPTTTPNPSPPENPASVPPVAH